jgi:hypothetical protein
MFFVTLDIFFVKRENVNKLTRGNSNYMWFDHGGLESVTKSDIFVSKFLFKSKIRLFGHTILPKYYNTVNPEKTICGREKWKKVSRIFWTAPNCSNARSLSSYSTILNFFTRVPKSVILLLSTIIQHLQDL